MPRKQKLHPAFRHGVYSTTTLLPGEDPAAFEKLRKNLKAELSIAGALEEGILDDIARYLWRKQNLKIFSIAERVRDRYDIITGAKTPDGRKITNVRCTIFDQRNELVWQTPDPVDSAPSAAELKAAEAAEAADARARRELGEDYELAKLGEGATVDQLLKDLEVQERLDAMVDRCLKRLLFVRGLKSLAQSASPISNQTSQAHVQKRLRIV